MLSSALLMIVLSLSAQATPPPPADYHIYASLDQVSVSANNVALGLWDVECRSGLQPMIQRLGTIEVWYSRIYNPPFGEAYQAQVVGSSVVAREDVRLALVAACPAMGNQVGLGLVLAPPPEHGTWTLTLSIRAIDSAGRLTPPWETSREIVW